ncbi:TonB-dependent receptor plug domain-containing protein [Sphingomonas xinjiangensis]|uniref:Iron complex outermembrane receptor protein n=1 Tax=Sphingomonas xinjiangensis TaxID=643568 RepID=A0A840YSB0_9SPHN|nr:TonB-dependent receptor [Sphingomonas xinjiangensis]MBB5712557.1 iron complex outermembrane receptor protein [Sphingomonas xinjiangensis]
MFSRSFTALLFAGAVAPSTAVAQAVDYSALSEVMGEPVTTSVTGKPQRASELPASTVIVTREQIARSPARDVPGLLKSYAGVDVNRWTAGQSDVAVRGGVQTYNARLLVLVDGRQVYLDHYGMTNWNLLGVSLEDIQQIELVRGPASALFGFNAASGVVNIITRKPKNGLMLNASAELGSHDYSRFAGTLMVPITNQVSIKLDGSRLREDERDISAPLLSPNNVPDVQAHHVSGAVIAQLDRTELTLDGGYADNRQIEYLPSQYLSNQHYQTGHVAVGARRDTDWGGLSFGTYANWLKADYGLSEGAPNGELDPAQATSFDNRIIVAQGSALIRLNGTDTLRVGGEYRNNRLRSAAQFSEVVSYDVGSTNLMVDLHPIEAVAVTLAGRYERLWLGQSGKIAQPAFDNASHLDRAFSRFSFNAGVVVQVGLGGQLRVNGGRGYQLPPLADYGLRVPIQTPSPVPVYIAGRPEIRPVPVWSAEVGFNRSIGAVEFGATGFWTRTEDAIATPGDGLRLDLLLTPAPVLISRISAVGHYTTYGAEVAASGSHRMLKWRANYSFTHTDQSLPPITSPSPFALSPEATTPRHKVNVEVGYDAGAWYLTAIGRYTSSTRQFAFTRAPQLLLVEVSDALAVDVRSGVRLSTGLELFASAENLTLTGGAAVSPIPADRRVRGGLKIAL